MFREHISSPIDPIPISYTNSIKRLNNEPDYSLTCLGVALLRSRIENYNGISGGYYTALYEESCVEDFLERVNHNTDKPAFYYYMFNGEAKNEACVNTLKENGYKIKENICALMNTKTNTECIAAYNEENETAVIIVGSRDIRYYHMLISFISLLFPQVFKDKPMTEADFELVKSLSKNDKNMFIAQIQNAVQPYVMEFRREMLERLLKSMHEAKIRKALNDVDSQRQTVQSYQDDFGRAVEHLRELIVIYEGMKATEQYGEPEQELIEYLSTNKQIHNLNVENGKMSFTVATLLNNYNPDVWDVFANKGYIFDGEYCAYNGTRINILDAFKNKNNIKTLLNSIFVESPEFSVKIAGNYSIDFNRCVVRTERSYDYESADPVFISCLPNPHIKNFACLGGYEQKVSGALVNRNYIAAVELCCASAGSVNLEETEQNFRPFIGWLLSTRQKVLRRKDGVDMTPEEALIYLIDKEKA